MAEIKKILCVCGSGLGSSFLMEMNAKKALNNLGITDVEVDHTTIGDITSGSADLFICGSDLLSNAEKFGRAIGMNNIVSMDEMTERLKEAFGL
ncbi:PTS system IIB component [Candidatus Arthromitus sp. SFB-mouse-Japan]|uniref:PTS sugar transporter subunit IIB n=1 Tax=unclassified Candidatus Neoarthromitus TaxID=2638829 RepID=UPI00021B80B5|nr:MULTISPECIES: PTS sugar transporter subunit IIB [unclassified Candidatus Arthromitus]EIA22616.1 Phosphotransferase system lactose/cellobiose-specific IIB subunit [Candidatus Arthromitus sp. SFB-1]EIA25218.1 Putative Phosphotransferase system lactose/cellobiose-specific IIB subunit [Candidatus Arthromitus sp. SFB-2]EIA25640.1 Phosphotransferase system lactose/cellobiose-specific IIB subunit [Candidatus Arthromitus sp. SFB-3]EIA27021.1 Phosphotransferase system lactose/cellobiose-specific IIB 